MAYTVTELADMVFVYGQANGNSMEAERLYQERYPRRRHPRHSMFPRLFQRLRETGQVKPQYHDRGGRRTVRTPILEEEVLRRVAEEPSVSTRTVAREMDVSQNTVWKVLKEQQLHPYHPQRVHAMIPADFAPRVVFSQWLLQHCLVDHDFPRYVLFTDEACFTKDGMLNTRNSHVWDYENPHATVLRGHQHRFSVNVWAGIVNDDLIGPFPLPPRLTGAVYTVLLRDTLPGLLEHIPLESRRRMWFQHDGASPHFSHHTRQHLNRTFPEKWIGRGGPVPRPARSPDLTSLDFSCGVM